MGFMGEVVSPGEVVNGYRIERTLGAGGQGRVYLARREGRPHALKFIHLASVGEWGWRELYILLRHQFPQVVRLLSHFKWPEAEPEYLVLVLEYVEGQPLYDWAWDRNLSAREVAGVLRKLLRALAAMHAHGVLHRDLKGANMLVREADGEPVLVDFGAGAMPGTPRATEGAVPPGTLAYRSPECLCFPFREGLSREERYAATPADELFALGVLLYVLLTNTYPFRGRDGLDLMRDIVQGEPQAPHERNPRVPRALGELCLRLLEKTPQDRPASAQELDETVEALLREADASWEVPLWKHARGRRPAAPVLVVSSRLERVRHHVARFATPLKVALLASLLVLVDGGARSRSWLSASPSELDEAGVMWKVGFFREVAPPGKPPEFVRSAAPPGADTPAPVADATLPEDDLPMKTQENSAPKNTDWRCLPAFKEACVGAACAALMAGCSGPQVIHEIAVLEDCPPGAVETMFETLGLPEYKSVPVGFPEHETRKYIPVHQGPFSVELGGAWGELLPTESIFSGQLYFRSQRVYGRITEVRTPDGRLYPICLDLLSTTTNEPGIEPESKPGEYPIRIFSIARVRPVRSFYR